MRSGANEIQTLSLCVKLVNQQEVATDMALPVVTPVAFQWMIPPLGSKGSIACNQQ